MQKIYLPLNLFATPATFTWQVADGEEWCWTDRLRRLLFFLVSYSYFCERVTNTAIGQTLGFCDHRSDKSTSR